MVFSTQKKKGKKGKLEQLPKIKFMYSGTVNGQVTQANGEYQWLRSGR